MSHPIVLWLIRIPRFPLCTLPRLLLPQDRLQTVFVSCHSLQVSDKRSSVLAVGDEANETNASPNSPTETLLLGMLRCVFPTIQYLFLKWEYFFKKAPIQRPGPISSVICPPLRHPWRPQILTFFGFPYGY
jgi:hypothetical protein